MKRQIYYILGLIMLVSCWPRQFKIEYDSTLKAIKATNKHQMIRNLTIWEESSDYPAYRFYLKNKENGSSVIFLEKKNEGYGTWGEGLFKFKPNMRYKISSTYLDSYTEIILFTNQNAEVDSVIYNYNSHK